MSTFSSWLDTLQASATGFIQTVLGYLPHLLGALLLLLAGWIVAGLLRAAAGKLGDGINRLLDRFVRTGGLARFRISAGVIRVLGNVGFWLVILFFVAAATRAARLDAFASWLDRVVAYIPSLLGGGLVILVGYLVSTLVRDLVSATLASGGLAQAGVAGAVAQGATFLVAIVIGIDQIGVDVTFLVTVLAIGLAGFLAGLAIAFGLGARDLVSNLIGAHDVQRRYQVGQMVRIAGVEGEILEVTPTSVVLETDNGQVTVPGKAFHEGATTLLVPDR